MSSSLLVLLVVALQYAVASALPVSHELISLEAEDWQAATIFLDATKKKRAKPVQQPDEMDDASDDEAAVGAGAGNEEEDVAPPPKRRNKKQQQQDLAKPKHKKKEEVMAPRKKLASKKQQHNNLHLQDLGSSGLDEEEDNAAVPEEQPKAKKAKRNKKKNHNSAVNLLATPEEGSDKPKHDISELASKAREFARKLKEASRSKDFRISSTVADLKASELRSVHMASKASSSSSSSAALQNLMQISTDKTESSEKEDDWEEESQKRKLDLLRLKARSQLLLAKESPTTFSHVKSATKAAAAQTAAAAQSSSSSSSTSTSSLVAGASGAVAANSNFLFAAGEDAGLGLVAAPATPVVKKHVNMDLGTLNLISAPVLEAEPVKKAQDDFVKSKAKLAAMKVNFALMKAMQH